MLTEGIDRLVDWRDFEQFVRDLYAEDPALVVEHDVTSVGKSGARRQTDVKVTVSAGGHELVILVECKHWKRKVDRARVDILAASVEDLNASKGVIFTTTGFEEGAEQYARAKGIDLFRVRDLTDEEWGLPGRQIWFYLHFWNARIEGTTATKAQLMSLVPDPPKDLGLNFEIAKDKPEDPALTLFSIRDGSAGPNLQTLILEARARMLALLASSVQSPLDDGADRAARAWDVPLQLDFGRSEHRELRRPYGFVRFDSFDLRLLVKLSQARFEHDRGEHLDFALAVENYMTRQRRVVARAPGEDRVGVHNLKETSTDTPDDDILKNGIVMPVILEAWVDLGEVPSTVQTVDPITLTLPDWQAKPGSRPN